MALTELLCPKATKQKAPHPKTLPKALTKAKTKPEGAMIDPYPDPKKIWPKDAIRKPAEEPKAPASPPAATAKATTTDHPAAVTPQPAAIAKAATAEAATPPPAARAKATTADPSAPPTLPVKLPSDEPPPIIKAGINSSSKRPLNVDSLRPGKVLRSSSSSPPPTTALGEGTESSSQEAAATLVSLATPVGDEFDHNIALAAALDANKVVLGTPAVTTGEGNWTGLPTTAAPGPAATSHGSTPTRQELTPGRLLKGITSVKNVINNAFVAQEWYMGNCEPRLQQYFEDLLKQSPVNREAIIEFKIAIGECKLGKFDTPKIKAIKRRIHTEEWKATGQLTSWEELTTKHGEAVAYAALRYGRLPYVPHTSLLPGRSVQWPWSHQFVKSQMLWSSTWKETFGFNCADCEDMPSQETIDEFLRRLGGFHNVTGIEGRNALRKRDGSTGTTVILKESRGPAETAPQLIPRPHVHHPDHSGKEYNDLHATTMQKIAKLFSQWTTHKAIHSLQLDWARDREFAAPVCDTLKVLMKTADAAYKVVCDSHTSIVANGRGYLPKKELEDTIAKINLIYDNHRLMMKLEQIISYELKREALVNTQAATA